MAPVVWTVSQYRRTLRVGSVLSLLIIQQWHQSLNLSSCVWVCLSAGGGYVLSAHCCCGVCSCGYAPFLCPCRRIEISPSPSCLLCDRLPARVCVSLTRGQRSCGLCLSRVPAPVHGPCLLWPGCGTVFGSVSASFCGRILLPRCCCGVHSAWSRCCCDGWSLTWGGEGGAKADDDEVLDCDCVSVNASESCRSLSGCVYCCNCGNKGEREIRNKSRQCHSEITKYTLWTCEVILLSARRARPWSGTRSGSRSAPTPAVPPELHLFPQSGYKNFFKERVCSMRNLLLLSEISNLWLLEPNIKPCSSLSYPLWGLLLIWVLVSDSFLTSLIPWEFGDFSSTFTTFGEQGLDAGEKPPSVDRAGVPSGFRPLAFSLASARNTFLLSTSFSRWS